MRLSIVISFLLHAALVGVWYLLPADWKPHVVFEPAIPIEILSEAEFAELTAVPPQRETPPEPEPEPEEITPDPLPEPVQEDPAPESVPPPEEVTPVPLPPEPQEEEQPAEPEEPEEPVEEAPQDPTPETPQEDPREEPDQPEPPAETSTPPEDPFASIEDSLGGIDLGDNPRRNPQETMDGSDGANRAGQGDVLTVNEEALLRAHLQKCWNAQPFIGAPQPEKLIVKVEIRLNRDGTLRGEPKVLNAMQIRASGNGYWRIAEREALNAVRDCAPYSFLPPDRYGAWQENQFNFNPAEMAGI